MRKTVAVWISRIAIIIIIASLAGGSVIAVSSLPDEVCVFPDMVDKVVSAPLTGVEEEGGISAQLFGIPLKTVQVGIVERKELVPCGLPFGVKLYTDGVLVVGMSEVETKSGMAIPAKEAGLEIGDIIVAIDGKQVLTNEQVAAAFGKSGDALEVVYYRNGETMTAQFAPALASDGQYKAGLWVRDSTAGIGTITFYDPQSGAFAGLGHGICDVDTGMVMPLLKGSVVAARIEGVVKGQRGSPGELIGVFDNSVNLGVLTGNSEYGIFGAAEREVSGNAAIPVASAYEISTGDAQILSTISGTEPQYYDIKIAKVVRSSGKSSKNMTIKIVDQRLLDETGGIVQGMSGSPIIQNGKLVGAVTHVLVNDPSSGYGIFIENMLGAGDLAQ